MFGCSSAQNESLAEQLFGTRIWYWCAFCGIGPKFKETFCIVWRVGVALVLIGAICVNVSGGKGAVPTTSSSVRLVVGPGGGGKVSGWQSSHSCFPLKSLAFTGSVPAYAYGFTSLPYPIGS